jgi:hypothetical protein
VSREERAPFQSTATPAHIGTYALVEFPP